MPRPRRPPPPLRAQAWLPQLHLVADHRTPGVDAEVAAPHRGAGGEARGAPERRHWMPLHRIDRGVQGHLAGHAAQRQLAVHARTLCVEDFDPGGDEARIGVAFRIQQVAGQRGGIPLCVAQFQRCHRDADVEPRAGQVLRIETDDAVHARERAQGFREAGMVHREHHPRMHRIDRPGAQLGLGGRCRCQQQGEHQCDRRCRGSGHSVRERAA